MKKITCIFLAVLLPNLLPLSASALELTCTPGALSGLTAAVETETELILKGEVDASDLLGLSTKMPSLRRLDLSACTVSGAIPEGAFAGSQLAEVVFPLAGSVIVGDFAFAGTRLKNVEIPASVSKLGVAAFAGCHELESVILKGTSTSGYAFANCPALKKATLTGVSAVNDCDFVDCPALEIVEGSDAVVKIGASAFRGAVSLASFDFGENLCSIGAKAFAGSGIKNVSLDASASLQTIGDMAFTDCKQLTSFSAPDKALIGRGALMGCSALEHAAMGSRNGIADYLATGNSTLLSINLPSEASVMGRYALKGASSVSSLSLPEGLTAIGDHAMDGMTSLQSISADNVAAVPALGEAVFDGIDRGAVRLAVSEALYNEFKTTPVWQEFDIVDKTNVLHPGVSERQSIKARFIGNILEVVSATEDIAGLELFDVSGRCVMTIKGNGRMAQADVSSTDIDIYIVRCTTASSVVATLKIAR